MALVIGVTGLSLIALAQAPAGQNPTFKTRTDLVQIDVSVLDQNRRPVRGLTAADFSVTEDGKPQSIVIFEPVDVPDPEPPPVEWMRDVTPDVTTNEQRVSRYWVFAIDDAMIPGADPWIVKTTKKIVRDLVDKLGPEDLATVVFTANSNRAQDFTNDRAKLLASLEDFAPHFTIWYMGKNPELAREPDPDVQFMLGSVDTVINVLDTLAAVPNTRKALIWVTPGVPVAFDMAGPVKVPNPVKPDSPVMMDVMSHRHLIDRSKQIFEAAKLANVPIYPIDPTGLGGLNTPIVKAPIEKAVRSQDHMVMTAANTGGRTVINTNEFTQGISDVFEENSSYYLVGYNPTNAAADGTTRRIEVKVNRPDVTVRTKSGYVAPKPGAPPPNNATNALRTAIAAPVPIRDLPLRAAIAPFAIPGDRRAAVVIALGVKQPVPDSAASGRVTVTTELRTNAYTTEGDLRGSQRHTAKVVLRQGAEGDADYEALSRIDLSPGRYVLRLAAFHESTGKTGTLSVDVLVPEFTGIAPSMSGVVLNASPGRPSAPRDLFREVLPVVPTAQRAFKTSDGVSTVLSLYQNAGRPMVPAEIAIRVVDEHDSAVITDRRTIGVDGFIAAQTQKDAPVLPTTGGARSIAVPAATQKIDSAAAAVRAAEVRYQLPLERLVPGRYLLTFEAKMGAATLRRDVQFEVRR